MNPFMVLNSVSCGGGRKSFQDSTMRSVSFFLTFLVCVTATVATAKDDNRHELFDPPLRKK